MDALRPLDYITACPFQPISFWLDKFQRETGVSRSPRINMIALNAALMESRKGFTPVLGNQKLGCEQANLFD